MHLIEQDNPPDFYNVTLQKNVILSKIWFEKLEYTA